VLRLITHDRTIFVKELPRYFLLLGPVLQIVVCSPTLFNMSVYADPRPGWHGIADLRVAHDRVDLHHRLVARAVQCDVLAQEIDFDRDNFDRVGVEHLIHAPDHASGGLFHHGVNGLFDLVGRTFLGEAGVVLVADEAVEPVGHFLALQYNRRHENIP
jgi:hypothetical protein